MSHQGDTLILARSWLHAWMQPLNKLRGIQAGENIGEFSCLDYLEVKSLVNGLQIKIQILNIP